MTISVAEAPDAGALAETHRAEIATGFLSQLGLPFLRLLYTELIDSELCVCLVAKDAQKLVGFVCGSLDTPLVFRRFKRNRPWRIAWALKSLLVRPKLLKGAFETAGYDRKVSSDTNALPRAELLALAVRGQCRRSGIGGALVEEFAKRMEAVGTEEFKVVVGADLVTANAFYRKMGFKEAGQSHIHADRPSIILVASSAEATRGTGA